MRLLPLALLPITVKLAALAIERPSQLLADETSIIVPVILNWYSDDDCGRVWDRLCVSVCVCDDDDDDGGRVLAI